MLIGRNVEREILGERRRLDGMMGLVSRIFTLFHLVLPCFTLFGLVDSDKGNGGGVYLGVPGCYTATSRMNIGDLRFEGATKVLQRCNRALQASLTGGHRG